MGSSRNRANWQLTTVKQSRNVLGLITAMTMERRAVKELDPDGMNLVFSKCQEHVIYSVYGTVLFLSLIHI